MKNIMFIVLASAAVYFAGCASESGGRYVREDEDRFGEAKNLEYPQKSRAITEMVQKMVTDPDFIDIYEDALKRAEARGHKRPTIVIKQLEDNTKPGSNDQKTTAQMHKELKSALRKTRKFAIIDLYERQRMWETVISEGDGGAADDNVSSYGAYEAGDFFMFGDLARDTVQKKTWYHFLNLRLVDPVTGDEIWDDTVKVIKED